MAEAVRKLGTEPVVQYEDPSDRARIDSLDLFSVATSLGQQRKRRRAGHLTEGKSFSSDPGRNHAIRTRGVEMNPKQYEGGCLCGGIRFRVNGEPGRPHTCSCQSCRKHSGSLTLTWVEFPAQNVEWVGPDGRPSAWRSSPSSSRAFAAPAEAPLEQSTTSQRSPWSQGLSTNRT
jgi:hypothetical protein